MARNILITGGAGYIGGSIVTSFASAQVGPLAQCTIHAAVRSDKQVESLSGVNVNVLQASLDDEQAFVRYVVKHEISIIINTATSIDASMVLTLIKALQAYRKVSGQPVFLIHTSGVSAFDSITGWTFGEIKDTDDVFEKEEQLADTYVLRKTDVTVIKNAEENDVNVVTVMPVNIYGRGTGTWNQMSVHIPGYIRSSIKHRKVYKFSENRTSPMIHINELTEFYGLLVESILRGDNVPSGRKGYYFVQSHRTSWWEILEGLAATLHSRGLVDKPETYVWPSPEIITDSLGVPADFAQSIWNSEGTLVVDRANALGWKPTWTTAKLLDSLGDEIEAAQDIQANKTSLLRSVQNKTH